MAGAEPAKAFLKNYSPMWYLVLNIGVQLLLAFPI